MWDDEPGWDDEPEIDYSRLDYDQIAAELDYVALAEAMREERERPPVPPDLPEPPIIGAVVTLLFIVVCVLCLVQSCSR